MVRTPHSHCQGPGSIPGRGTKIPQAAQHSTPPDGSCFQWRLAGLEEYMYICIKRQPLDSNPNLSDSDLYS